MITSSIQIGKKSCNTDKNTQITVNTSKSDHIKLTFLLKWLKQNV